MWWQHDDKAENDGDDKSTTSPFERRFVSLSNEISMMNYPANLFWSNVIRRLINYLGFCYLQYLTLILHDTAMLLIVFYNVMIYSY